LAFDDSLEHIEALIRFVEQLPYTELAFDDSLEHIEALIRFVEQLPYT